VAPLTTVIGAVMTIRSGKKKTFLDVRSRDGFSVQVVCLTPELPRLTVQSYVRIVGKQCALPAGVYSQQTYEIQVSSEVEGSSFSVLSLADEDTTQHCPPDASPAVRLDQRLFLFRDPRFILTMRMIDHLSKAFRCHFRAIGSVEVTPPSFTGVECEGGATLFKLDHPGRSTTEPVPAFLTQSSQFALEYVLPGVGKCCHCLAPSFRAEHSLTRRHLTEFMHGECEWEGVMSMDEHVQHLREMLVGITSFFLRLAEKELVEYGAFERVRKILVDIQGGVTLTHREMIEYCRTHDIYKDEEKKEHFGDRDDVPEKQERAFVDSVGKVVFLTHFPREFKSFYMALDPVDPSYVLGCDVLVPTVGEVVGSGVREQDFERLTQRLVEAGLKPDDYREYLALRRSGFRMTSGMGLGMGRLLCWYLEIFSIRDATAFPRFPGYLRP